MPDWPEKREGHGILCSVQLGLETFEHQFADHRVAL